MFHYDNGMEETKAYMLINRAVHLAFVVDVLLVAGMFSTGAWLAKAICLGMFLAQCGLCCTAYLRNDNMREESITLFVALVMMALLVSAPAIRWSIGYVLIGLFLWTSVAMLIHVVPVLMLRFFLGRGRPQFSIMKMIILTTLLAVVTALVRWGDEYSILVIGAALAVVGVCLPSALACWLVNFTQRTGVFLSVMLFVGTCMAGVAVWLNAREVQEAMGFLLTQWLGSTIGGVILLQVKPSPDPYGMEATACEQQP